MSREKRTRLKRLPVISHKHFRKTRTNYLFGISNTCLQNGISNTSAKKAIGISNTNWYTNWYLK
jgi:hypothetical protein